MANISPPKIFSKNERSRKSKTRKNESERECTGIGLKKDRSGLVWSVGQYPCRAPLLVPEICVPMCLGAWSAQRGYYTRVVECWWGRALLLCPALGAGAGG